jgi:microcystin-dependent protein
MPDAFTPNLGLTLPEVGASRDTWGAKLNANTTTLDTFVGMATPIGAILDYAGTQAPSGWLIADGRLISRTTYSALFAVIGVAFGAGDGSTTFALPNLTGRAGVGPGTMTDQGGRGFTFSFATTLGYVWNVIAQANLPNYNLVTDTQGYHSHGGGTLNAGAHYHTTDLQGNHSHGDYTSTETVAHVHYGNTDAVGDHTHGVNAWATSGGGSFASPGAVGTQGGVTTNPAGAHGHSFQTGTESALHQHQIYYDGNHAHTTTWVGDHAHSIYADGNHQHNVALGGGGQLFSVLSPVIVITKIVYAGNQAATRIAVTADAVTLEGFAEDVDELAAIRQELAEVRALLTAAPLRQRLLSAPIRGPH